MVIAKESKLRNLLYRVWVEEINFGDLWRSLAVLPIQKRVQGYERNCDITVRRVQRAELLDHEEQENDDRQA